MALSMSKEKENFEIIVRRLVRDEKDIERVFVIKIYISKNNLSAKLANK